MFSAYPNEVKIYPASLRPVAVVGLGVGAWPVIAYSTATFAGVDGCVRSHGVVGFIATHGAMMHPVPTCPATTVGHGQSVEKVIVAVMLGAVLATVINVLAAVVGTHAAEWVHAVAGAIGAAIAPALPRVKTFINVRLSPVVRTVFGGQTTSWATPWRRGPPVRIAPQW